MFGNIFSSAQRDDWRTPPPIESIRVSWDEYKSSPILLSGLVLNIAVTAAGILSAVFHSLLLGNICEHPLLFVTRSLPAVTAHGFGVLLGFIIVLREWEFNVIVSYMPFLSTWVGRGIFLIFCGCIQNISLPTTIECIFETIAVDISLIMMLLGAVYALLGCLCFRYLQERDLNRIKKKKQTILQAQQLSQHKEEVEAMLRRTERQAQSSV
jgi:hypothetical protein